MTHWKTFRITSVIHMGRKDRAKGERTECVVGLSVTSRQCDSSGSAFVTALMRWQFCCAAQMEQHNTSSKIFFPKVTIKILWSTTKSFWSTIADISITASLEIITSQQQWTMNDFMPLKPHGSTKHYRDVRDTAMKEKISSDIFIFIHAWEKEERIQRGRISHSIPMNVQKNCEEDHMHRQWRKTYRGKGGKRNIHTDLCSDFPVYIWVILTWRREWQEQFAHSHFCDSNQVDKNIIPRQCHIFWLAIHLHNVFINTGYSPLLSKQRRV